MASTTIFRLYSSIKRYDSTHVPLDNDNEANAPQVGTTKRVSFKSDFLEAQMELKPSKRKLAVEVNDAILSYGQGIKKVFPLKSVTLSVACGEIYGLLGPSGCGKTTLLRSIVGRLRIDSGSLKVFGEDPRHHGSSNLGERVGYMPQEIALFPDFTINETLFYFANLYGIGYKETKKRIQFLISFLELPDKHRMVSNLSGGQRRRVSLAVALVHAPPLLILDEPTVGVDPLLRQTIWSYLGKLAKEHDMAIIITTHYVEEARGANTVGLMRNGRILCEAPPDLLLEKYKVLTLEEVFLKLCHMDSLHQSIKVKDSTHSNIQQTPDVCNSVEIEEVTVERTESFSLKRKRGSIFSDSYRRTSALFKKNLVRLRRNLPVLMFQFLLPSIEVIIFCLCIGRDPFEIPVSVYNGETGQNISEKYSDLFLNSIDPYYITQVHCNSSEEALNLVKAGETWGSVLISENFTHSLSSRVFLAGTVDNETITSSQINVNLDMTNQIIGYKIQRTLVESWRHFSRQMALHMELNPAEYEFPIQFQEPIYGGHNPSFTEFMAPGVLLSIAYLAAVALTALAFVMERKEGLLERSLVAGVTSFEFLLSHVLTQLLVISVQIFLLLLFTFVVFDVTSDGPFLWVILMTFLQAACGMAFGLMISSFCEEENSATMLALGSFYPNLLLSGTVWPVQAMPEYMRYVAYILPQTIPVESMRYILSRGWDVTYPGVAHGFAITIGWTIVFLASAIIIFHFKK